MKIRNGEVRTVREKKLKKCPKQEKWQHRMQDTKLLFRNRSQRAREFGRMKSCDEGRRKSKKKEVK